MTPGLEAQELRVASTAAQHLAPSKVAVLLQLVQTFTQLAQHDVSTADDTALANTGPSQLLDAFKAASRAAVDLLQHNRPALQASCSRLAERSELLQKEVLKAEISMIFQAYKQQTASSQAEHMQQLQNMRPEQLWQHKDAAAADGSSSTFAAGLPDIAGWQPAWELIQLEAVAELPSLLKLLEAGAPPEAVGQLAPGSTVVLQWFSQHQAVEACLRHGLEGQGQILRTVYDFCPQVLRVSSLLAHFGQNVRLCKQLVQEPLSSILHACDAVSGTAPGRSSSDSGGGSSGSGRGGAPDDGSSDTASAELPAPAVVAGPAAAASSAAATAALSELLSSCSPMRPLESAESAVPRQHRAGLLTVLHHLQRFEHWAYEQITEVVWDEAVQVLTALQRLDGFAQRAAAADRMQQDWHDGSNELVEARRLARRGILERLAHKVS